MKKFIGVKKLLFFLVIILVGCSETPTKSPVIFNNDKVIVSPDDSLVYLKKDMSLFNGLVKSEKKTFILGEHTPNFRTTEGYGHIFSNQNDVGYRNVYYPSGFLFYEKSTYKNGVKEGIQKINYEELYGDQQFIVFKKGNKLDRKKHLEKREKYVDWLFSLNLSDDQFKSKLYLEYDSKPLDYEIVYVGRDFFLGKKYNLPKEAIGDLIGQAEWGDLLLEYNIKNGKLEGLFSERYLSGQLMTEKEYKNGELDGLLSEWYPNGQLRSKRDYKDGKFINGECWNNNGSKVDCKEQSLLKSLFFELLDNELYNDE
jgi:antitoxin component YwqK of YwqJK toxin-antitoxin module